MKQLQCVELFTDAEKLDGFSRDRPDRQERTTAGIAVALVLVRGMIVFANRDRLPPPRPTAAQPQPGTAPPPGRVGSVDVLDKVNDALRK